MKRLLIRFGLWLLKRCGYTLQPQYVVKSVVDNPFVDRAAELCVWQETNWPDRSGESKRHQVLARLIKDFPDGALRDLAMAIELAVRKCLSPV